MDATGRGQMRCDACHSTMHGICMRAVVPLPGEARSSYQELVIEQTAIWRPHNSSSPGQDMCTLFFHFYQNARANGTNFGNRILVPMCVWHSMYHATSEAREGILGYLETLDIHYKYFMIEGMDKGLAFKEGFAMQGVRVPKDMDLLVFTGGGTNRGARNIPIPLLKETVVVPTGQPKDIALSRGKLDWIVVASDLPHEEFDVLLERSNMTLTPRGHGTSSYRMYEALQLLAVPVYIWVDDKTLPFEELINWNEIAIILNGGELRHLRNHIDNFDVHRAQNLLKQYRHMWTHAYLHQYITDRLQKEPLMLPIPVAAYSDQDTIWDDDGPL